MVSVVGMASVVYRCLSFVANDVIFFSDDVQTTTIAVAIASSLCCSIVWAVFHIISVVQPSKGTAKAKSAAFYTGKNPTSRKNSYQTVGINILKVQVLCFKISFILIRKDKRKMSEKPGFSLTCIKCSLMNHIHMVYIVYYKFSMKSIKINLSMLSKIVGLNSQVCFKQVSMFKINL